jgi:hypothetical protein
MKLPRNEEAQVSDKKIRDYLLSEAHPVGKGKAGYFRALGYSEKNIVQLRDALVAMANTSEVTAVVNTPYGTKYVAEGDLVTPSGIGARICTVWILETEENTPRFVTAYPTQKEDIGVESD